MAETDSEIPQSVTIVTTHPMEYRRGSRTTIWEWMVLEKRTVTEPKGWARIVTYFLHSLSLLAVLGREYGFYCWGLIVTLLLIILLIIVSVILLITTNNTVLVLSVFIAVLLVVAAASFLFIEWQRRQAALRRDNGAREWITRTLSQDKLPTAPPQSAPSTSWMFWRKTSSVIGNNPPGPLPTAPPHSARSSWTLSRQSYLPVYIAENRFASRSFRVPDLV